MAGQSVSIWIPCEVFEVSVSAEDAAGPSSLERAALLYLAARKGVEFDDLARFLHLGKRVALDLVNQLWYRGYLLIDASIGSVSINPAWRNTVEAEQWDQVTAARRIADTKVLMRELVSGQVVADRSTPASPRPDLAAPILVQSKLFEVVDESDLAHAVQRDPSLGGRFRRRTRSLRVKFADAEQSTQRIQRQWFQLEFDVAGEEILDMRPVSYDDHVIDVISPGIARALNSWTVSNQNHHLVTTLWSKAQRRGLQPRLSHAAQIEQLRSRLENALAAPALFNLNQLAGWRRELAGLLSEIQNAHQTKATFVLHTGQQIAAELPLLICGAFHQQLVVLGPNVGYRGVSALAAGLKSALLRLPVDVRVFVLWGSVQRSSLPSNCRNRLDTVATETTDALGPRLWFPDRTSRLSSSLALADERRIFIASFSLLAEPLAPDEFLFALEIDTEPGSKLVSQLLEIARERTPDFAVADRISLNPYDPARERLRKDVDGPDRDSAPILPMPTVDSDDDGEEADNAEEISPLEAKARLSDLLEACKEARDACANTAGTVEILVDDEIFRKTLDIVSDVEPVSMEPTLVLGLASSTDRSSAVAIHRGLVEGIEERAERGYRTIILVGHGSDGSATEVKALDSAKSKFPTLVLVETISGLMTSFVSGERQLIVGASTIAGPPEARATRLSNHAIGLSVVDQVLCADFRKAIGRHWPALVEKVKVSQRTVERPAASTMGSPLISGVVSAWRRASHQNPDEPWLQFEVLQRALRGSVSRSSGERLDDSVVETLLEVTKLARYDVDQQLEARKFRRDVLSAAVLHGTATRRDIALSELAQIAWYEGEWQCCAILVEALPADSTLCSITRDLVIAAAEVEAGIGLRTTPSALPHEADRWLASMALCIKAVLLNGDADAAETLEAMLQYSAPASPLTNSLHTVAKALLEYWRARGEGVDANALRGMIKLREAERLLPAACEAFDQTFRRAAVSNFQAATMRQLTNALFTRDSSLNAVATLIPESRDDVRRNSRVWTEIQTILVQLLGTGGVNLDKQVEHMIDEAHRKVGVKPGDRIVGRYLMNLRSAVRGVVVRAIALRDALLTISAVGGRAEDRALEELAVTLRNENPALGTADLAVDAVPYPLIRDLYHCLQELTEYVS